MVFSEDFGVLLIGIGPVVFQGRPSECDAWGVFFLENFITVFVTADYWLDYFRLLKIWTFETDDAKIIQGHVPLYIDCQGQDQCKK